MTRKYKTIRVSADFAEALEGRRRIYQEIIAGMGKRRRVSIVDTSELLAKELKKNDWRIKKEGILGI